MQHRLEYALLLLFRFLLLCLPIRAVQLIGAGLGSAAFFLLQGRRNIALDNLRRAFPEKTESDIATIARGSFRNYGITIAEMLWFPRLNQRVLQELITLLNPGHLAAVSGRGKGMVLLTGHFGNWELIAVGMAVLERIPFTIIVQTQNNKLVDRLINRHRTQFGNRIVPMGISVREIIKTLHNNGVVAMAPDQSGPQEGVFVDFFGRSVATHQGPAAFSLRCSAPMVMGFIMRKEDGRYEVFTEEIPTEDLSEPVDANILELTRRHTRLLESYIRQYPDHWLWMHRRWKHLAPVESTGASLVPNA